MPALSRQDILKRFDGDLELCLDVSSAFLGSFPAQETRLLAAADAGDLPALRHAAHALRGAAGNFSSSVVYQAALELEEKAAAGDLAAARSLVQRVLAEGLELCQILTKISSNIEAG